MDTESKGMFVFDVKVFGLDERIQNCFSNPQIIKIMFDCRRDSDSLYYAYGTILNGVVDLQIMDYVITHSEKPGKSELPHRKAVAVNPLPVAPATPSNTDWRSANHCTQ